MAKPRQKKLWSEDFASIAEPPWNYLQRMRYLEEFGSIPEEFPEGSLGAAQFAYNPRTKVAASVIEQTLSTDSQ
jgi:hypothetical protein